MTLVRIALREHRRYLIGFTLLAGVLTLIEAWAYPTTAGTTPAERAAFVREETALGRQFAWLYPLPVRIDTLGGFLQWHVYSVAAMMLAVSAVFLGTTAVRIGEERGRMDVWLSAGVSRRRVVAIRTLVGLAVLAVIALAAAVGVPIGAVASREYVEPARLVATSAGLWALMATCFALGMLVAQVMTRRRPATGVAASLVVALLLINGFSRELDGLRPARLVSPFHWFDETSSLAPGAPFSGFALVVLLATMLFLVGLCAAAFLLRDLGGGLLRARARDGEAVTEPSRSRLLRIPVLSTLRRERWAVVAWAVAIAVGAVFITGVAKPAADLIDSNPQIRAMLPAFEGGSTAELYLGFAWFGIAALITVAFAITEVARWIADDVDGRLGAELSAPVSRRRVVAERLVAVTCELVVLSVVDGVAVMVGSRWFGISLSMGRLSAAAAMLVPLGLAFAAVGAVMVAVRPRATVAALSAVAVVSYLVYTLGPLLKLPGWALNFSAFQLYGTPLTAGVFVTGLVILLCVGAAAGLGGVAAFERREIGA